MATDKTNATTPPSLFGMDRKMAYAKRKYHSGWIWGGVTMGLAGVKFSGSVRRFGLNRQMITSNINIILNPTKSL